MAVWNPWRGCRRFSEGCKYCYIHKGDARRGVDTSRVVRTAEFGKPTERLKNGDFRMKSGLVYLCFNSDFLIAEADWWRPDCWRMIRERQDCRFLFLTKRIERFAEVAPPDWGDGSLYENVVVCCTVENQREADHRLRIFAAMPIKHKCITLQPLLGPVDVESYLDGVELVVVGGESDWHARPLYYEWVLDIWEQCRRQRVSFEFRQCGTYTVKDGKKYTLTTSVLRAQAKKAGIDLKFP